MGEQQAGNLEGVNNRTDSLIGRWRRPRYTLGRTRIRLGDVGLRTCCRRLGCDCVRDRLLPTDRWRVDGISDGDSQHHRIRTKLCYHAVVYRYGLAELFHYRGFRFHCLHGDFLTVHVEGQKPEKVLGEDIRALC